MSSDHTLPLQPREETSVRYLISSLITLLCLSQLIACGSINLGKDINPYEMQRSALRAYDSGDDAKAEAIYLGLIRISPNDPENLLRLGNLYARSNRPDRAAETYTQAVLLNPNDSRLWYNLGVIRQRQGLAAMIQAQLLVTPDDPLHSKLEAALTCLAPAASEITKPITEGY